MSSFVLGNLILILINTIAIKSTVKEIDINILFKNDLIRDYIIVYES